MSLKKKRALEKFLIAAAIVVAVVVGVVVAQTASFVQEPGTPIGKVETTVNSFLGPTNMAGQLPRIAATLDLSYEVDQFAAIYAFRPNPNAATIDTIGKGLIENNTYADRTLDPTHADIGDNVVGNVGYIMVETNFSGWDVIVSLKNNGLMRGLKDEYNEGDDDGDTPNGLSATVPDPGFEAARDAWGSGGWATDKNFVNEWCNATSINTAITNLGNAISPIWDTAWSCAASDWKEVSRPKMPGKYLRIAGPGATTTVAPIMIGMGSIKFASAEDFDAAHGEIALPTAMNNTALVESYAPLVFTQGVASLAQTFYDLMSDKAATADLAGGTAMNISAIPTATNTGANDPWEPDVALFGPIDDDYSTKAGAFEGLGNFEVTGAASTKLYPAMMFFVNGGIDRGEHGGLRGNRNGIYTETITFTFWGVN